MGYFFYRNEKILTFSEYVLSESISFKNKDINYGYDEKYINKKWKLINNLIYVTFAKIENELYCITIVPSSGDVSFSRAIKPIDRNKIFDIEYLDSVFSDDRHETKNILKFFGNILWVLMTGIKKYGLMKFRFDPVSEALGLAYSKMVNNKYLIKEIKEAGYKYIGDNTFKKV